MNYTSRPLQLTMVISALPRKKCSNNQMALRYIFHGGKLHYPEVRISGARRVILINQSDKGLQVSALTNSLFVYDRGFSVIWNSFRSFIFTPWSKRSLYCSFWIQVQVKVLLHGKALFCQLQQIINFNSEPDLVGTGFLNMNFSKWILEWHL